VVADGWCDDPEPDAVNLLIAEGVSDVEWPSVPAPDEVERRHAGARLVAAARDAATPAGTIDGEAAGWAREADLLLEEIKRRRVRTIDVAVPSRLTTSQIVALTRDPDGFAADLARPRPARPVAQARRGSRFHQWVEELYAATPLIEPDDLPGAGDGDVTDDELAALQAKFLADGWGERRPVEVEAPFETMIGGRLVRGRIDAVYREDAGTLYEGYDVIDYKTGSVLHGADFEAASHQLSIYRLAWADLAGVDPSVVRAGFLYVRTGELKRPTRLLDRDELAALLSTA
jgi:DNA helicase-2/ATP-dependent DNA helicase PcrA